MTLTRHQIDNLSQDEFMELFHLVMRRVRRALSPRSSFLNRMKVGESLVIERGYLQTSEKNKARVALGNNEAHWITRKLGGDRLKVTRTR